MVGPEPAPVVVDVEALYRRHGGTALLRRLPEYEREVRAQAGRGTDVVLTGAGPIWLYLRLAHALHGIARRLTYESGTGERVVVFDHSAR